LLPAPIIVLAPVDATTQLLEALESGATDYATRPLDGRALLTRIHTTLARSFQIDMPAVDETVEVGPLIIEPSRRRVSVRGTEVHFAKMEYEVLLALALRPGEILTNSELLDEIWAGRRFEDPRTLSTHIRRIRKKLEIDPGHPQHLLTVRGVGFYFNVDGQESCAISECVQINVVKPSFENANLV
jgi:two-component system response regulator RegX3